MYRDQVQVQQAQTECHICTPRPPGVAVPVTKLWAPKNNLKGALRRISACTNLYKLVVILTGEIKDEETKLYVQPHVAENYQYLRET